jgi:hypothetical protein
VDLRFGYQTDPYQPMKQHFNTPLTTHQQMGVGTVVVNFPLAPSQLQ